MRTHSKEKTFARRAAYAPAVFRMLAVACFLLFAGGIGIPATAAQNLNSLITINKSNAKLLDVMGAIEQQSNYLFVYNKDVDVQRNASLNVEDRPLADVLADLFNGSGIRYSVEGSYIMLSAAKAADAVQQAITVTGKVMDGAFNEPMPGVAIQVQGTTTGTVTDLDGNFTLEVPSQDAVLIFSFVGYKTQNVTVGTQRNLNITMQEDTETLEEVVVTALGIQKKEKSLTYSTQVVGGDELTRAKDANMMNSLAGKTAGVQILRSSSGLGGSVKISIRGSRSASGSNQPLYVIDGMPINSSSSESTATVLGGNNDGANRDNGDGISNLNPDDIESMNILKGPAAAALYGASAANGVVVITTKKGKVGRTSVTFNSNTTWDWAAYGIPEFQNSYGGETTSWGDPISGSPDYTDGFFNTGVTTINSISLSSGSEAMQTYFSYANTYGKGVVGKHSLNKHNFNFRETANFFDKKLQLDANVNLMFQDVKNRPASGGFYLNPLVGVYTFPRGGVQSDPSKSFNYYKNNYEIYDSERNLYTQNWYTTPNSFTQNPYWLLNKLPNDGKRYRTIANLTASWQFNEFLKLQARGNVDFVTDTYQMKMYAGTDTSIAGTNGRFISDSSHDMNVYGDVLLTYNRQFKDFSVNASLGASIKDISGKSTGFDSFGGGLYNPNIFSVGNINQNAAANSLTSYHEQEQAVFFAGQLGYKDWLYLDVTARNDWTSTLAFTKYKNKGFFYPSVGLTWILNESLKMPEWVDLGKLRAAWSKVGNGLSRYISNPLNSVGKGGVIDFNSTEPFDELKPEMTTSVEVGTEWRFLGSRLELDLTYYQTRTKNQLFTLAAPSGSKYSQYYINAGDIKNEGVEMVLGATPVITNDFRWKTSVNFALNRNTVVELAEGLGYFDLGGNGGYGMRLEKGGSFGDIYGYKFQRDEQGNVQFDKDGLPVANTTDLQKVGNTSPDFNLGWSNTFTYKGFSLYFLIDGRFGGDVMSLTQAELDLAGVSKATGEARDRGYVDFGGRRITDVAGFYNRVGGRQGATEYYMYSATNIRLRELSLSYSLPKKWFENTPVIKGIDLSLIGRNLFFFMNNAPFDPDGALSMGNSLQGVDVYGMPSTRSFGFNVKVNF